MDDRETGGAQSAQDEGPGLRAALVDKALANASLQAIADAAAALVGDPVAVQDFMHEPIAVSSNYPADDLAARQRRRESAASEEYQGDVDWVAENVLDGRPHIRRIEGWPGELGERMYCGCLYAGRAMAFMRVVGTERPLGLLSAADVEFAARLMAAALMLKGYPPTTRGERWPSFLWNLLENDLGHADVSRFIDQPLFADIRTFRVYWVPDERAGRALSDALAGRRWFSIPYHGGQVALAGESDATVDEVGACLPDGAHAGASEPFQDVRRMRQHYEQARDALEMARLFYGLTEAGRPALAEGDGPGRAAPQVAAYDRYALVARVARLMEREDGAALAPRECRAMLAYDKERGTPYGETAYAYLVAMGNVAQAARALYVHKNTVLYRLRKMRELFGLDLSDGRLAAPTMVCLMATRLQ